MVTTVGVHGMDSEERNLYSAIFKTKELDVRTFADVMRRELSKEGVKKPKGVAGAAFDEVAKGDAKKVATPKFTTQSSGFIQIEHGWHQDDYIWHIGTNHPRKDWKVTQDRLVYAIAATLDTIIPKNTKVNIHPPVVDWEIKEYTVKALDLKSVWNISNDDISRLTEKLFKVLNALV